MAQNFLTEARCKFAEYEKTAGTVESVAALDEALDLCDDISSAPGTNEAPIAGNLVIAYKRKTIEVAKAALNADVRDYDRLTNIIAACECLATRAPDDDLKKLISALGVARAEAVLRLLSTEEKEELFRKYLGDGAMESGRK